MGIEFLWEWFEDAQIVLYMNEYFVKIKVGRLELRSQIARSQPVHMASAKLPL